MVRRVFKKSSPNEKLTLYMTKRDFIDHGTHVDPVDGILLIDTDFLKGRRVFVHLLAAFRYGNEDLDVLGLAFRKDLFLVSMQVYPPVPDLVDKQSFTVAQKLLMRKLGKNAHPFYLELPHYSPASVTLQPKPEDNEKPCGVDYELHCFVEDSGSTKYDKKSSVRMLLRKLTYEQCDSSSQQPSGEVSKDFLLSSGNLQLKVTLDKEKYYHGETICVNVCVDNKSNRKVKGIRVSVIQETNIVLYNKSSYKCVVADIESEDNFPILPNQLNWSHVYHLCPVLENNRHKRGLALDGKLRHEDTNLASSTIIKDQQKKENLGIIVQYLVKVKLLMGLGRSDIILELPFILTHPKPPCYSPMEDNNENNSQFSKPMQVDSNISNNVEKCRSPEKH